MAAARTQSTPTMVEAQRQQSTMWQLIVAQLARRAGLGAPGLGSEERRTRAREVVGRMGAVLSREKISCISFPLAINLLRPTYRYLSSTKFRIDLNLVRPKFTLEFSMILIFISYPIIGWLWLPPGASVRTRHQVIILQIRIGGGARRRAARPSVGF
eukprot:SAG31_NODE_4756_length_2975_cov_2.249652_3_plen_157_part_00